MTNQNSTNKWPGSGKLNVDVRISDRIYIAQNGPLSFLLVGINNPQRAPLYAVAVLPKQAESLVITGRIHPLEILSNHMFWQAIVNDGNVVDFWISNFNGVCLDDVAHCMDAKPHVDVLKSLNNLRNLIENKAPELA